MPDRAIFIMLRYKSSWASELLFLGVKPRSAGQSHITQLIDGRSGRLEERIQTINLLTRWTKIPEGKLKLLVT